ncbi:MAG: type II secretion system secretin GspD [Deltaproteobacteria bacterium]|nr:type II secretion system secretin GspD [Deltaproteobacteria bacterium]MCL4874254.1 type II secretion system secretin GspD [bacterium]
MGRQMMEKRASIKKPLFRGVSSALALCGALLISGLSHAEEASVRPFFMSDEVTILPIQDENRTSPHGASQIATEAAPEMVAPGEVPGKETSADKAPFKELNPEEASDGMAPSSEEPSDDSNDLIDGPDTHHGLPPLSRSGSDQGLRSAGGLRPAAGTAMLNFNDAGLREVLRTVGELTGENFIIAPGINARVSVETVRPVRREDILAILESILEVNGLSVVKSGDYYKVVPASGGRQHPGRILSGKDAGEIGVASGITTLVVPLDFISANDMLAVLKPMLSSAGSITALPKSNTLVITDGSARGKGIIELIKSLDVDAFGRVEIAMVPVRNADARALYGELTEILSAVGIGKEDAQLAVVPLERLNSLIVLSSGKELMESVAGWIGRLDTASLSGSNSIHIYYARNDRASNLMAVLDEVYGGGSFSRPVVPGSAPPAPAAIAAMPEHAQARGPANAAERARILLYEPANALIINAPQGEYRKMLGTLNELDRLPRQVLIEALIAEIKLDESTRFGIQWSLLSGEANIQQNTGIVPNPALADPRAPIIPPIGAPAPSGLSVLATDASRFFAAIQALASEGKVDILSNPHIMVKNYEKASINVGSDEPVSTQSTQNAVTGTAGIIQNIEYRKTGVILTVVPYITEAGKVAMTIRQEVSDRSTDRVIGNATYPSFTKREAETSVVAADGETLVIGGLIQERFDSSSNGIPVLSRVPVIGNLFKFRASSKSKTELVILIKPTVVAGPGDAASATREFRDKLPALKKQLREKGKNS